MERAGLGQDAEAPSSIDAVGLEIREIDSENSGQRLTLGEVNEGRVGKIHRAVVIAMHQPSKCR